MATKRWLGRAQAISQVDTVTVTGTWANGDTVTLTINQKSLTVTIGDDVTTSEVATTIKQAWENETLTDTAASFTPDDGGQDASLVEHSEITATVSANVVSLTSVKGTPFELTVGESTAGSGLAGEATPTSASGPNHWDDDTNWDGFGVPVNSDDVYFSNSDVSVLWGKNQSAVTLASMTVDKSYTGNIGRPRTSEGGYTEYRESSDYLEISVTALTIGSGNGIGSSRIKIDTGSNQTAVKVLDTAGGNSETGIAAFIWVGTHASNTFEVQRGSVAIAQFAEETAQVSSVTFSGGSIYIGALTCVTGHLEAGTVLLNSNITTLNMTGGTLVCEKASAFVTVNQTGGLLVYNASGGIGTLNIGGGRDTAVLDMLGNNNSVTIGSTALNQDLNSVIKRRRGSLVTISNVAIDNNVTEIVAS